MICFIIIYVIWQNTKIVYNFNKGHLLISGHNTC